MAVTDMVAVAGVSGYPSGRSGYLTAELVEVERFVQLFHALLREEEGRFEE
jgi:hypothetical protein